MNEKLVNDYIPLAKSLARRFNPPRHVSRDEIQSAAYMGLVDAASKFDPCKGSFANYASIRIVGEIKDHLKKSCIHDNMSSLEGHDVLFCDADSACSRDFFDFVCSKLGAIEEKVVRMYYVEDRTLKEIGDAQGVSESRVSQILSKCHKRIKCSLN